MNWVIYRATLWFSDITRFIRSEVHTEFFLEDLVIREENWRVPGRSFEEEGFEPSESGPLEMGDCVGDFLLVGIERVRPSLEDQL